MIEMLFEILRGGRVVCWTSDPALVYPREVLEQMQSGGHTFRMNGREVTLDAVLRMKGKGGLRDDTN